MHVTFYHDKKEIFSFDVDTLPQVGNTFTHMVRGLDSDIRHVFKVLEVNFIGIVNPNTKKNLWVEVILEEVNT